MQHKVLTMEQALAKMHRRRSLWHTAFLASPDLEAFRANLGTIQSAIERVLIAEFGRP